MSLPGSPLTEPLHDASRARWLMLGSVALFVGNALLIRVLGASFAVNSWTIATARFIVGMALVLFPFLPGRPVSLTALVRNPLLVSRGILGGIGIAIYYETVIQLGVGRATFINNTYIIISAVLAAVFLREKLRPTVVFAIILGTLGIALLTGMTTRSWAISPMDLLALLGALIAGVVVVIIRKLHQMETTRSIFAGQCAWGMLIAAGPTATHWETPAALAVLFLVLTGLLAGTGQLAMTAAYRFVPVAEGALLQMLTPVGIGIGGILIFQESYTPSEGLGAVLIVTSCILAVRTRPRLAAGLPPAEVSGSEDRPPGSSGSR